MAWYDYLNPIHDARLLTNEIGITSPAPPDLSKGPDAQRLRDAADTFMNQYKGAAPTAAPVVAAPSSTNSYDQRQALGIVRSAALGEQPSAAEGVLRKGVDEGVANSLGMAAALQGNRPGLALGAGLTAAQRAISGSAADAATLRANEMAASRGQLVQAANDLRAGDLSERGQNIDVSKTNTGNELASRGMDINERLGLGDLALRSAMGPYGTAKDSLDLRLRNEAANSAALGTLGGAGAYGLAKSDETTKEDIHASPEMADDFLDSLKPKTYRFKDPSEPGSSPGTHLGVIAQDLASGTMTAPDGKKWISADVIGRVLAGMGRLNDRLEGVEGGKR